MKKSITQNLFQTEKDMRIITISSYDALYGSDNLKLLRNEIIKHEDFYPNIDKWFDNKVIDGLKNKNRIAYLVLLENIPIATAILKLGESSKFCHLSIDENYQYGNIGNLLFSMMIIEAKRLAKSLRFTLPEHLWLDRMNFFQSFGFSAAHLSSKQYRKSENELYCSAPFSIVWDNVKQKLPIIINEFTKYHDDLSNGILMSIKPKFLDKIAQGNKTVELRRTFNQKWLKSKIILYSSSPRKAIYGYARIEMINKGNPKEIWEKYYSDLGCSKEEYDNYVFGSNEIFAITLADFKPYTAPVLLSQLDGLMEIDLKPPQSYLSLKNNDNWRNAVSITELLHGNYKVYQSI